MKAYMNISASGGNTEGYVEHNGKKIMFSTSVYIKRSFKDTTGEHTDPFEQVNNYWSELRSDIQDKIFNIYLDIHIAYGDPVSNTDLYDVISDKIAELYQYHTFEDMSVWTAFKGNIAVPPSIPDSYVENVDNNTSTDKTYIRKEYTDLMVLSIIFRVFAPIWGEHIAKTKKEKGNQFKEYFAFKLLHKTGIFDLQPLHKLKAYIDANIGDKARPDNILKNIPSEEFSYWLLALVCTRKLTVCDISVVDNEYSNISYIYKYVKNKAEATDSRFENLYHEKRFNESGGSEDNKLSTIDMYKIKANISPGEIAELEFSLSNKDYILGTLAPTMDKQLAYNCIESSKELINHSITEPQLLLLGWVFKPVMSPKGFNYIPKNTIVEFLGILEAVLRHRGHHYLALLASSYAELSDSELVISPVDSKIRVPVELQEELEKQYPYTKTIPPRRRGNVANIKSYNIVTKSINDLANMYSMYSWILTSNPEEINKVLQVNTNRCQIPPDIKTHLTKLVIELGSGQYAGTGSF